MEKYENHFERLLKQYIDEVYKLECCYYSWKTINNVINEDDEVYACVNENSLFWGAVMYSLKSSAFMTLGRIFDTKGDTFSVDTLIDYSLKYPKIFSKEHLRKRKLASSDLTEDFLDNEYLLERPDDIDSPENLRMLKDVTSSYKETFRKYKKIRDKLHAHKSLHDIGKEKDLYRDTLIGELEEIIEFLRKIWVYLWELFHNGRKIDLEAPLKDTDTKDSIISDTKNTLKDIAKESEA